LSIVLTRELEFESIDGRARARRREFLLSLSLSLSAFPPCADRRCCCTGVVIFPFGCERALGRPRRN